MNVAQLNIARTRFPLDSPEMKDFVDALPEINGLGDRSPGFVWRLQDDNGDATSFRPFGRDDVITNLTVWESVEALRAFTYQTAHLDFMRRRREWFDYEGLQNHLVLWGVPSGHQPSFAEAKARLEHLDAHGSTPHAFTLRHPFDPED